jgi:four helix bundle protein
MVATGKPTTAERRRYLAIARGSAMESSATLDVLVACGLVEAAAVAAAQAQLERIVAMLSKRCR